LKLVGNLTGVSLQIVEVDDELLESKEHKALNPTGTYPLLETDKGSLAGVVTISKYLCKQAKKLLGSGNAAENAQINQWLNYSQTTLQPLIDHIGLGLFEKETILQSVYNDTSKELKSVIKMLSGSV